MSDQEASVGQTEHWWQSDALAGCAMVAEISAPFVIVLGWFWSSRVRGRDGLQVEALAAVVRIYDNVMVVRGPLPDPDAGARARAVVIATRELDDVARHLQRLYGTRGVNSSIYREFKEIATGGDFESKAGPWPVNDKRWIQLNNCKGALEDFIRRGKNRAG